MTTYDNYAYERVRNAYDKTYDKIMRTTKLPDVRQYSYACRTRTQDSRTATVRTGPNCRTCRVRVNVTPTFIPIPYVVRTSSLRLSQFLGMTYGLRRGLVRLSYGTIELESISQSTGPPRTAVSRARNLINIKDHFYYKCIPM